MDTFVRHEVRNSGLLGKEESQCGGTPCPDQNPPCSGHLAHATEVLSLQRMWLMQQSKAVHDIGSIPAFHFIPPEPCEAGLTIPI